MAKPLKMTELAQAVEDAARIVKTGLRNADSTASDYAQVQETAFELVLTELLENEYTRDLP